jgi:hypothetical protein
LGVLAVARNPASSSTRDVVGPVVGPVVESTILSVPYMDITLMRHGCISEDVYGYDGDRKCI